MVAASSDRRYTYGPVPSRRLGRSLGIDLVPPKTCTYDCVYCQLGRTTDKTVERREYVPVASILAELEQVLDTGTAPDHISLAGSGEPTLHAGIGHLLAAIKDMTDVPVAVITNGSLLWDEKIQEALLPADLVLPSLDAGDARMFETVNRPHEALSFDDMVEGLVTFTRRFRGEVWLEVMLLAGITDGPAGVEKIAALAGDISPARIQLNTAHRPPAERFAGPVPKERMSALAGLFSGQVELIGDFGHAQRPVDMPGSGGDSTADAQIVALLERRPCTAEDVAGGLGLHVLDVLKHLDNLLREGRVQTTIAREKVFYSSVGPHSRLSP